MYFNLFIISCSCKFFFVCVAIATWLRYLEVIYKKMTSQRNSLNIICVCCFFPFFNGLFSLSDVLSGGVGFFDNDNLCYINTINWEEILAGFLLKPMYVHNSTLPERSCKYNHSIIIVCGIQVLFFLLICMIVYTVSILLCSRYALS